MQRINVAGETHQRAFRFAGNDAVGSSQLKWRTSRIATGTGSTGRMSIAHGVVAAFPAGRHSLPPALLK
jgi:hypothetical protein